MIPNLNKVKLPFLEREKSAIPEIEFRFVFVLKACLHRGGGPQVGEVTRLGGVTHLSIWSLILIWSRLHVRWGDPPYVTLPIWGPPPPCKQALTHRPGAWTLDRSRLPLTPNPFYLKNGILVDGFEQWKINSFFRKLRLGKQDFFSFTKREWLSFDFVDLRTYVRVFRKL